MSGFVLFAFTLIVLAALIVTGLAFMVRRQAWGRLALVALLTRVFDRPQAKAPARARL